MIRFPFAAICAATLAAWLATPSPAVAGKPSGGGTTPPPTGTIYFEYGGSLCSVPAAGGAVSVIFGKPAGMDVDFPNLRPSHGKGADGYWWVVLANLPGWEYDNGTGGLARSWELIAIHPSGDWFPLTNFGPHDPTPDDPRGHRFIPAEVAWAKDDSFVAAKVNVQAPGATGITESEHAIYAFSLTPQDLDAAYALHRGGLWQPMPPDDPAVTQIGPTLPRSGNPYYRFDLSPDGLSIARGDQNGNIWAGLIGTAGTPVEGGFDPRFRRTDNTLAFTKNLGEIWTLSFADGGASSSLVMGKTMTTMRNTPQWSPDGKHIVARFLNNKMSATEYGLHRFAAAPKSSAADLTPGLNKYVAKTPVAWRD